MTTPQDFKLPDVGEGLTEAEVVIWHVAVGDSVEINDIIVDIETAKSVVELPSPYSGVVAAIHVETGVTVEVGTTLISIGDLGAVPSARKPDLDVPEVPAAPAAETAPSSEEEEPKPLVLVGTGPTEAAARTRRIGRPAVNEAVSRVAVERISPGATTSNPAWTKPPVRALAKRLGVDLASLAAHADGLITRQQVEAAAAATAKPHGAPSSPSVTPVEDQRETRIPIKGVRKMTAEAMTRSAFTAPHVTLWLTADVTNMMDAVQRLKADRAWTGVRVNPMLYVARAFLLAIRSFPDINASWDEDNREIVLKHYVNLGIAAATPRGLIVPNIKNADAMDLRSLASQLADLVTMARSGKTPPADMARGTVTITNIGALGVDAGTPILNPGESAILAFGAVRPMPWVVDGQICVRQVTQLAMSFDHRLVDGELGSKVLARVGELLNDPGASFLYGDARRQRAHEGELTNGSASEGGG
jgi:2-oxoisovalerate dehydrogenase E2 component (dihydrolipoyl transacylase)